MTIPRIGRPPKFESPEQLRDLINKYFESCWVEDNENRIKQFHCTRKDDDGNIQKQVRPYSVCGLAIAIGTNRDTLLDYENSKLKSITDEKIKREFSDTIKEAKMVCQRFAEEYMYSGKYITGAMFSLKANYRWEDTQKVENTVTILQPEQITKDEDAGT